MRVRLFDNCHLVKSTGETKRYIDLSNGFSALTAHNARWSKMYPHQLEGCSFADLKFDEILFANEVTYRRLTIKEAIKMNLTFCIDCQTTFYDKPGTSTHQEHRHTKHGNQTER